MKTRIAKRIEEVLPVLEFAEREARAGSYVAVMLSYEAAPAFDSAFVAHAPSDFPLAWASSDLRNPCTNPLNPVTSLWKPLITRDEYDRSVARIRELIAAGDTYQVNYSFPLTTSFSGDAHAWYRSLCQA